MRFLELRLGFLGSPWDFWSSQWDFWAHSRISGAETGLPGIPVGFLELKLGFLELTPGFQSPRRDFWSSNCAFRTPGGTYGAGRRELLSPASSWERVGRYLVSRAVPPLLSLPVQGYGKARESTDTSKTVMGWSSAETRRLPPRGAQRGSGSAEAEAKWGLGAGGGQINPRRKRHLFPLLAQNSSPGSRK